MQLASFTLALGLLVGAGGAPALASTVPAAANPDNAAPAAAHAPAPPPDACVPPARGSCPTPKRQFIGPFELRKGLLPNGLLPNPPTYG